MGGDHSEGGNGLVSYRSGDIVEVVEEEGGEVRVGRVEGLDQPGVQVVWEDGTRKWFPYDLWSLENFDNGFSILTSQLLAKPSAVDHREVPGSTVVLKNFTELKYIRVIPPRKPSTLSVSRGC